MEWILSWLIHLILPRVKCIHLSTLRSHVLIFEKVSFCCHYQIIEIRFCNFLNLGKLVIIQRTYKRRVLGVVNLMSSRYRLLSSYHVLCYFLFDLFFSLFSKQLVCLFLLFFLFLSVFKIFLLLQFLFLISFEFSFSFSS